MKFRSQTEHILPINPFFPSFSFFLPLKIQIFHASRSAAVATQKQENSNRLNTFSSFQSVVFIMVRIVFEFSNQIFSDLFPLFNMLATAMTKIIVVNLRDKLEIEYGTKRITKQTKMRWKTKKPDSISKLKWKSKPIDFWPMKSHHWIFWLMCWVPQHTLISLLRV